MKIYLQVVLITALIGACQNKKNNSTLGESKNKQSKLLDSQINALQFVEEWNEQPLLVKLDNTKEGTFSTDRGSLVLVPRGAVVYEDGSEVKGEYVIKFKEYHTLADFISSGIIMGAKNEEGEFSSFISDGMFSIEGIKEGKKLKIADNKEIEVKVAAYKGDGDYPLWKYNVSSKQWESMNQEVSAEKKNNGAVSFHKRILKGNSGFFSGIFSFMNGVNQDEVKSATQQLGQPINSAFELNLDWQRFPNLQVHQNKIWECVNITNQTGKTYQSIGEIFKDVWENATIVQNDTGSYFLNLVQNGARQEYIQLQLVEYGKAGNRKVLDAGNINLRDIINEKSAAIEMKRGSREILEAEFNRVVRINTFGIFNCDKFSRDRNAQNVTFDYQNEKNQTIKNTGSIYAVDANSNSIFYLGINSRIRLDDIDQIYLINDGSYYQLSESEKRRIKQAHRGKKWVKDIISMTAISSLTEFRKSIEKLRIR